MDAVRGDGSVDPEARCMPEAGKLYLWPAFPQHLAHPNLVDVQRLSKSVNMVQNNRANHQ